MIGAYTRVRKFLKPVVSCASVNERRLNGMLEKDIERKLQRKVKAAGGVCLKFIWDVLRPAEEVMGINLLTQSELDELLLEAKHIIERWAS